MLTFLLSTNFDRPISSHAYYVGLNGSHNNCHFSDADFGYSLVYEKLKWWTGMFSILDFILSNNQRNIPAELLILNEEAKPFYDHRSPNFLCSGSIDFSPEKLLNLISIRHLNSNSQIIGKSTKEIFDHSIEDYCNQFLIKNIDHLNMDKNFQPNGCFFIKTKSFVKNVSFLKKTIGLIFLQEFNEQNLEKSDLHDILNILFLRLNEKNTNF
jgi:hypothetical protein